MTDKEILDLLQEAHREPISPAHYAAVRARVLAELRRERRPVWRRVWVSALSAAAAVVLLLLFPRPVQTPDRPASWGRLQPAAEFTPPEPARGAKAPRRLKPAPHRRPPPRPPESVVVKLLTDDPNVVIYWISQPKGE